MATLIVFHEVENGQRWANAWRKGAGSRHELFAPLGVTARTFHDPENPDSTGLILEVGDLERFRSFMATDIAKKAMEEDGLKVSTLRILSEFTP